ncbi:hypothetical protein [Pantoea sp. JZ2]|uniref:hypothetical protein n=1 Tax=Pantoea sp. JZ2 TaxID=2654189 RepID=UPI002B459D6A|nr:hypothetical protein [Pantoea sp. JZ2]
MCGPVAIGVAMLAATAASAYSQRQQSKYQSELANYNADLQEKSADAAINAGNAQADQMRARARQLSGNAGGDYGSQWRRPGRGTAVDILATQRKWVNLMR